MAQSVALSAVTVAACFVVGASIPGGWYPGDPMQMPHYIDLAHFAISQRFVGLSYYDTVLQLQNVQVQVVQGTNIRLTFTIAPSTCLVGRDAYNPRFCRPATLQAKATCTATVYEVTWERKLELTSLTCI